VCRTVRVAPKPLESSLKPRSFAKQPSAAGDNLGRGRVVSAQGLERLPRAAQLGFKLRDAAKDG
jgi:hypothetical protein